MMITNPLALLSHQTHSPQFQATKASVLAKSKDVFFSGRKSIQTIQKELAQVRSALLMIAAGDTAFDADGYQTRKALCPLSGHCAAVADWVQKCYGGQLVRGEVSLRLNGQPTTEVHYWNQIDGVDIDLTGSQYGGDGVHALDDPAFPPKAIHSGTQTISDVTVVQKELRDTVTHAPRFDVLAQRLTAQLHGVA